MHAQSPHVSTGLAAHPEDAHVLFGVVLDQLALVDRSYAEISLDGRDHRRPLKQGATERLERLGDSPLVLDGTVESDDAHVLFARRLLRLDEPGRLLNAHDQAAGHLV